MIKCPYCGGEMLSNGNGYRCKFCGNTDLPEPSKPKTVNNRVTEISQKAAVNVTKRDHGADVFDCNIGGVLEIEWFTTQVKHSGSGLLITEDGYALTNTHVVTYKDGRSCEKVTVRINGQTTTAKIIKLGDNKHGDGYGDDLALIKLDRVPQGAKVLTFENFANVRIGERVFVIGNSLGYGTCITNGIVSDKSRNVNGKMLMMTDCAVNGGNSGGPIFNDSGLVIGVIVSGISSAEGMNFAIPSSTAMKFLNSCNVTTAHCSNVNTEKKSSSACPQCGGSNFELTSGGFYWCHNCDCEW